MDDLAVIEESCQIISLVIWFGCCRRAPVSSAVITDGMEPLAESRPDFIPNSRIYDSVVEQDDSIGSGTALLVIQPPPLTSTNAPRALVVLDGCPRATPIAMTDKVKQAALKFFIHENYSD